MEKSAWLSTAECHRTNRGGFALWDHPNDVCIPRIRSPSCIRLQVRGMRPLGNGAAASEAVSAPQAQLRGLVSGGLPAPADTVKLLADYGISGIRQTWQAPSPAPYPPQNQAAGSGSSPAQYPTSERNRLWNTQQFTGSDVDGQGLRSGFSSLRTPEGVDELQPLGAGARGGASYPRPLKLLTPSPTEGGRRAAASAHARGQQPPNRFGRLTPQGSSEGLVDVYDVRAVNVLPAVRHTPQGVVIALAGCNQLPDMLHPFALITGE